MDRLKQLSDSEFVLKDLLRPSIDRAVSAGRLTATDAVALKIVAGLTEIKASDLSGVFPGSAAARSYQIRRLTDNRLIEPLEPGKRAYRLVMAEGPLAPFIIRQLDALGFLPEILRDNFGD